MVFVKLNSIIGKIQNHKNSDLEVGLQRGDDVWVNIFLLVVDEAVEERVHLGHHQLGLGPGPVPGDSAVGCQEDHDRSDDVDDSWGRGPERFQLCQVGLQENHKAYMIYG